MPVSATTDQQNVGSGAEQSTEDHAAESASGVEGQEGTASDSTQEETTEEQSVELLGQDEYDKLKNDPAKLMKALNKAATQKFQSLAADRKELEPLKEYAPFLRALDKDPIAAITAVAKQLGLKVDGASTATETKTKEAVTSLGDQIIEKMRENLGEEYGDLADRLGAAVTSALEMAVPELTKASREQLEQVINDSAARESEAALAAFGKKYPEWQKHEPTMVELSKKILPGEGMTEVEYLEVLYHQATRDKVTGDGVKKVINRMAKSAAASTKDASTVSDSNVSRTSTKPPTFKEAAAAAQRGERWE